MDALVVTGEPKGEASASPPLPGGLLECIESGKAKRLPPPPPKPRKPKESAIPEDALEEWIAKAAAQRKPPANAAEITEAVEEAQAALAAAAETEAFAGDPYRKVLAGLSCVLGVLPQHARRMEDVVSSLAIRLDGFAGKIEAATARVGEVAAEAKHPIVSAEQVAGIATAAEKGAVKGAWRTARELRMRHVVVAACTAAASVAIIAPAAWFGGRASVRSETAAWIATERSEVAGLTLPLADAADWARLIRLNPPPSKLRTEPAQSNDGSTIAWLLIRTADGRKPATPGAR